MIGKGPEGKRLATALTEFRTARRQAALKAALGRLQGASSQALLSYNDVVHQLKVMGQVDRGVHEIRLDKIVGSVGRYEEFDRSFLPLKDHDAQRWATVRLAAADPGDLPPIEVYQIGAAYFVIDGNHRVSIARKMGLDFLDAHVIEIRTRAPLPDDLDYEAFILAAEYASFLEHTGLDHRCPDAELKVSMPGQYDKLENHIEVHRYFVEEDEGRTLTDEEAVERWCDEVYSPVVEAIREHGLLRGFEGRTETDLYLWIAHNQAALRNELGWEVSPQAVVLNVPKQLPQQTNRLARLYRRTLQAVFPEPRPHEQSWAESKTIDRYSDRLFADILVGVDAALGGAAWEQALPIAQRERAHLLALPLVDDASTAAATEAMRADFDVRLQEVGLPGELGRPSSTAEDMIRRHAKLADIVVVDRARLREMQAGGTDLGHLAAACNRPLLIALEQVQPLNHVLLLCDARETAHEALFVAAYMAERWDCLVTLQAGASSASGALDWARAYLAMHEIEAMEASGTAGRMDNVFAVAAQNRCDLVVAGTHHARPWSVPLLLDQILISPAARLVPLLLCP